ncbi:T9SS type A sorting domain-containing protein [Neolewinella litorea]|uniref:T9SS type A sorting domain-containing protein n=1 Tax=Neolewinella litorea TaxID=2562452 RepID=A0A4S4NAZ6_9BACT|nr:T9SS type A sorting domain-containing protein [Neolewinella litorea]THH36544.1 T9SS type A sorting domain-containing protein [Neolewinella litorea]
MKYLYTLFFLCLSAVALAQVPTTAPPAPTVEASKVISLFSDAYTDVSVDTWRTDWSSAEFSDVVIADNAVKLYSNLDFAGIEMTGENALNLMAAGMTHLHIDFWSANSTTFRVKLVDFGGDGFDGGNDTEKEVVRSLPQGEWVSIDYPLAEFSGMNKADISQFIISSLPAGASVVYLDNIFFYEGEATGTVDGPTVAAPTPTRDAATVVSLFSDAYTDVSVDTWLTEWSSAKLKDTTIAGNAVKLYYDLDFAGIEMTGENALDLMAAGMTHLNIDFWSPNSTTFRVKLVDFGGDGFDGGNDTDAEIARELPQGEWVSLTYSLSSFAGLNTDDISQLIISSLPVGSSMVYLDNIYFYSGGQTGGGGALDLPVTFEDEAVTYGLVDFGGNVSQVVTDPTDEENHVAETTKTAGAEIWAGTTLTVDAGGSPNDPGFANPLPFTADATTVSVRVWSPTAGTPIRLKVENSADVTVTVETEAVTTVAMEWETLVFDFANEAPGTAALNLAARYNKMSIFFNFGTQPEEAATYYWDDVYFGGESTGGGGGGGGADGPTTGAPAPVHEGDDIISLFSEAYNDVTVDTWRTDWSSAAYSEVSIDGNATKLYTNLDFAGIETVGDNALDLTGMTHLHVDYWSDDLDTFRIKLVDFGMDGFDNGTDTEFEIPFRVTKGEWVRLDIPLEDFEGMNQTDINQFIISALPTGSGSVYLDNIYFYNSTTVANELPKVGVLSAYPNPVTDRAVITAPVRMESLVLFDANGRLLAEHRPGALQYTLPMENLRPGMYVALVTTAEGQFTVKLRKQ